MGQETRIEFWKSLCECRKYRLTRSCRITASLTISIWRNAEFFRSDKRSTHANMEFISVKQVLSKIMIPINNQNIMHNALITLVTVKISIRTTIAQPNPEFCSNGVLSNRKKNIKSNLQTWSAPKGMVHDYQIGWSVNQVSIVYFPEHHWNPTTKNGDEYEMGTRAAPLMTMFITEVMRRSAAA